MKDNDQSRFVRWGIPGWMMFLAFLSYSAIDVLLSPESSKNKLMVFLIDILGKASSNTAISAIVVLSVAAAGIPLGFFIYQIYFYIRWNSPFSRDGFFPPFIVGRWNDLDRTVKGIDEKDIAGNDPWRNNWTLDPLYTIDHGLKWRYIENFFTEIVQKLDSEQSGLSLYARYRYLMDLMHSLGAGLFGIYLGYLGYLFAKVKADNFSLTWMLLSSAITLALLMALLEAEDRLKRDAKNIEGHEGKQYLTLKPMAFLPFFQFSNPSAIYLFFCFAILCLGSPSPYVTKITPWHILLRFAILILIFCSWWFSKRKNDAVAVRWSEVCTLAVLTIVALLISGYLRNWSKFEPEWWNIGWSILIFLVTNMIFIKNRQNTRDDLIAMQNYTIKRYLSLEKQKSEGSPKSEAKPVKEALLKLINRLWF